MGQKFAVSEMGLKLIKTYEGFRPTERRLVSGQRIIGYGHVSDGDPDRTVSRLDAEALLKDDLAPIEAMVNENIHTALTQGQFDALCSLAFNIGQKAFLSSEVVHALNNGRPLDAASAFDVWRKSQIEGRTYVIDALVRRRTAEKALFLRPLGPQPAASRLFLPPQEDTGLDTHTAEAHIPVYPEHKPSLFVDEVPYDQEEGQEATFLTKLSDIPNESTDPDESADLGDSYQTEGVSVVDINPEGETEVKTNSEAERNSKPSFFRYKRTITPAPEPEDDEVDILVEVPQDRDTPLDTLVSSTRADDDVLDLTRNLALSDTDVELETDKDGNRLEILDAETPLDFTRASNDSPALVVDPSDVPVLLDLESELVLDTEAQNTVAQNTGAQYQDSVSSPFLETSNVDTLTAQAESSGLAPRVNYAQEEDLSDLDLTDAQILTADIETRYRDDGATDSKPSIPRSAIAAAAAEVSDQLDALFDDGNETNIDTETDTGTDTGVETFGETPSVSDDLDDSLLQDRLEQDTTLALAPADGVKETDVLSLEIETLDVEPSDVDPAELTLTQALPEDGEVRITPPTRLERSDTVSLSTPDETLVSTAISETLEKIESVETQFELEEGQKVQVSDASQTLDLREDTPQVGLENVIEDTPTRAEQPGGSQPSRFDEEDETLILADDVTTSYAVEADPEGHSTSTTAPETLQLLEDGSVKDSADKYIRRETPRTPADPSTDERPYAVLMVVGMTLIGFFLVAILQGSQTLLGERGPLIATLGFMIGIMIFFGSLYYFLRAIFRGRRQSRSKE